jgi:hypothetical protein
MRSDQLNGSLSKLRLSDLRPYLEARGWSRTGEFQNALAVFGRGLGSLDQVLVPMNPGYEDFNARMQDAILKIADDEQRPLQAIIQDLLSSNVDTLRYSIRSSATDRGTLPLEQGLSLLEGARKSLLAAACTVLAPTATFHARMSRSDAEDFVQACELGQTEQGSYTLTLRCPMHALKSGDELPVPDNSPPFGRLATETLVASVSRLVNAIDHDHIDAVLQPNQEYGRVTANLCDALIKMQPDGEYASLSLAVSWAPSIHSRVPTNSVVIRGDHFSSISEISKQLRGSPISHAAPFVAIVDELRGAEQADDGRRCGEVRLTIYQEDEALRARANLNADQYAFAVEAHMRGSYVMVSGVLNRGPRLSYVADVVSIHELEQARIAGPL